MDNFMIFVIGMIVGIFVSTDDGEFDIYKTMVIVIATLLIMEM